MNEPKKTLVEGLKVEGESWRDALCRVPEAVRRLWWSMYLSGDVAEQLEQAIVAAQHLKREQEGRCTCVVMTPRNIYLGGRHLDDSCPVHTREQEPAPGEPMDAEVKALLKRVDEDSKGTRCLTMAEVTLCLNALKQVAAQPPQELVSLREALQKHRYDYDDIHLRAKCSCGWEYDAAVGRHNGWDWWAIHFEAPLASDFAETEKAIRNLSWDESCNGKWTAVVRVEHVLAILRAALTRGAVGGTK